jgi:predicted amidohydrolase
MTTFPTVRVAAIQATPVILDAEGCVEKAERLLHEAADRDVQLAVLPECFIPLYPSTGWAHGAGAFEGWGELWERLWANAVDVPGPLVDRLVAVCRERELFCVIGVNERESVRPGTLYNTALYLGPSGLLARHRKLMPTQHERFESGAFVVSVPQFIPASAFPDDFPVPLASRDEVFGRGGAAVIEPATGQVIAGPLYGEEGFVVADCDLRVGLHAKRWFDSVGHYSREDVLLAQTPTIT